MQPPVTITDGVHTVKCSPDQHTVLHPGWKLVGAEDDQPGSSVLPEPPRSGAGSGVEAWAAYAVQEGVVFDDTANRDTIIALVDAGAEPKGT
jgi:hypothetical protein